MASDTNIHHRAVATMKRPVGLDLFEVKTCGRPGAEDIGRLRVRQRRLMSRVSVRVSGVHTEQQPTSRRAAPQMGCHHILTERSYRFTQPHSSPQLSFCADLAAGLHHLSAAQLIRCHQADNLTAIRQTLATTCSLTTRHSDIAVVIYAARQPLTCSSLRQLHLCPAGEHRAMQNGFCRHSRTAACHRDD